MDKTVRDVLERAFPVELVKTRKGSFGKTLAYVEVAHYIARLNEAFGGGWSFDVIEHQVLESEVIVLGRLTAGNITKTTFGGSAVTVARESGEQLSISDDLKAAASDSLKKACSLLGIGQELYLDQSAPSEKPAEISKQPSPTPLASPSGNHQRLTQRQHGAITGLADRAGISGDDLGKWIRTSYGVTVEELDRRQASEIITKINQSLAGGNGNDGNRRSAGGAA